jgi:hypothetical protein
MTHLCVWPDATYIDLTEYNEEDVRHKGDDYFTIDLYKLASGRLTIVDSYALEDLQKHHVPKCRLSELLQAELQLKATSTMFRNYRNSMREHLAGLHDEQSSTIAKLSAEQAAILANKEQEIKTILTARDQWVKELQGKLHDANKLLANSEEVNEELENRIAILNARPPSPAFQGDLAEENRRLKSQLAGATARIRKQIDGYGTDWRAKAEAAEAELAKAVEISDTMEDQIERMRIQLNAAEDKATFCAKERDKCAAKVDNLETLLSELYQVLGALDAPVKVLDLVTKVLDGHGFDPEADSLLPFTEERDSDEEWSKIMQIWVARAEAAETELAKLKNTSAISSDIEDNLRKERYRYGDLLAKHGVCTECGDMYEHHEDEPFASCSCHTAEWGNGVSTPYMSLQRALREARDAEQSQAEKVDELKEQISEMKRNASAAISMLQEIE